HSRPVQEKQRIHDQRLPGRADARDSEERSGAQRLAGQGVSENYHERIAAGRVRHVRGKLETFGRKSNSGRSQRLVQVASIMQGRGEDSFTPYLILSFRRGAALSTAQTSGWSREAILSTAQRSLSMEGRTWRIADGPGIGLCTS